MKKCCFCNSSIRVIFSTKYGNFLCHKHYMQYYHTGKLKKRFRKQLNQITVYSNKAEISLYDTHGEVKDIATIDIDDVDRCSIYKWSLHIEGYAHTRIKDTRTILFLHNFISGNNDKSKITDHINHNKLDNRKSNLRICSYSNNNMNSNIPINNTSGYKGVSYNKRDDMWESYLAVDNKRIKHKYFETLHDAVDARKMWEKEFFGEYRYD